MRTHYIKQRAGYHAKLTTPLESIIYAAIPDDQLVTAGELHRLVDFEARKHGEKVPPQPQLASLLESMTERGFVKTVHGVRLERLLASV